MTPNAGWNLPAVFHNGTGATATYITTVTQPTDELNLHPGANGERSVVRWTAPSAMTVQVAGRFEGLDSRGDSSDAAITHNGTQVFAANVTGNGVGSRQTFSLTRTVVAGDTLEFSVGYGTSGVVGDSTGLAVTITQQVTLQADVEWLVVDQLGTPRMVVDQTGSLAGVKRHDYLPYGEELFAGAGGRTVAQGYVADQVRQKFTGYERDAETGLDFAQARYFSSSQGRFTSPDPFAGSMSVADPQTFNRYTYTGNNPVNRTDVTGLDWASDASQHGNSSHYENNIAAMQSKVSAHSKNNSQFEWEEGLDPLTMRSSEPEAEASTEVTTEVTVTVLDAVEETVSQNPQQLTMIIIWGDNAAETAIEVGILGTTPQNVGHVSYIRMQTDNSLSWDNFFENVWTNNTPSSVYTNERSKSSAGMGYLLDFHDPKINAKFQDALYHAYDRGAVGRVIMGTSKRGYDPVSDNCGQAFDVAINAIHKDIGVPKTHAVRPVAIEQYIKENLMPRNFVTGMQKFPKH